MAKDSVGVVKLQPWVMVSGEKYSSEGNLEAHYYHAKDNNGKVLFTTKSGRLRKNPDYVLLALPEGQKGVMYKLVEQGRYPELPSDPSFEVPSSKGITFLKMRNSAGSFELNNTVMEFVRDTMPNEVGVLIRNGENTWLTWLDSQDISLSEDSFTSKSSDEETSLSLVQSRYYLFNLIMGLIERNQILQLDHVPTNMFSDPGIIWSNADSQITDSTYVELAKIIPILNQYSKADDPIYVLNSFTDSATYTGRYGGGTTERGRGDNALTDSTSVKEGLNKIKGIDYFSNFTYRFYVGGEKYVWHWDTDKSKISPSLYIEDDEFINLKFINSNLINYYIHTKRIGKISNSGRYVDYSHMLPILFRMKQVLEEQEKVDRLHIVAQDYDLNLLTSFKIIHDVRVVTPHQAKRYSKWVAGLSDEDKSY